MWTYHAPIIDMRFVMERVLKAPASWQSCAAFDALDMDTTSQVLEEAARFASDVLLPLNAAGDTSGCTLQDAQVRTPAGYANAYRAFVEGGWPALPCDPAWGGQGLPLLLDAAMREMLTACNHAWTMYPDLLHGAYETIKAHASDELKQRYLEKIATGEWLAAMALTEPQAGSDLGLLRTRATPVADGSVRITGNKIFISGADHDLTDNIVHLVLCRLPDAPAGTKGISLALVPKQLPDGSRNAWLVDSLEHKMGIHGSATCAVRYEDATGWLVGEANRGLAAMFAMMNSARLHVGLQGLAHQEMAVQNALRYAQERAQMRAAYKPEGVAANDQGADLIAYHPAMRHKLFKGMALAQGSRVIAYRAAQLLDEAAHHQDEVVRAKAAAIAPLYTPIVKAFLTHQGFHSASDALQVFGGYGYIREYGIEQTLRDSRIAMIYEGTNEIQAIDLLTRKLLGRDGDAAFTSLMSELSNEADQCAALPALHEFATALKSHITQLSAATQALRIAAAHVGATLDAELPLRIADDYLMAMSYTLLAWAYAASARAAQGHADANFAKQKRDVMRYGMQWILPDAAPHFQRLMQATQANASMSLPWLMADH